MITKTIQALELGPAIAEMPDSQLKALLHDILHRQ